MFIKSDQINSTYSVCFNGDYRLSVSIETYTVSGIYWIRFKKKKHMDLLLSTDPDESV